jgi:type I restriction enzyme S subunit
MNFDRMRALLLDQAIRGELVPQLVGEGVVAQIGTSLEEVPFEIPESWKWVPFSSIATLLNGRTYKKTELLEEPTSNGKDNTPILRVGNLFTSDKWYYSDLTLEDNKYCNPGDLLYAWSASFGPTIWQGCRSIYHYHIWRVDHNSSYVNKKWLYFWLLGKTQDLKRSGHGLAMIHITKKGMEQELVALPPLQEQVRIVAKLEEAFAEIDRAEKAYEELQTLSGVLRGQILQEAIQGKLVPQLAEEGVVEQIGVAPDEVPFEIPESWRWVTLASVGKTHTGTTPSTSKKEYFGSDIPFVKPGDIDHCLLTYREDGLSTAAHEVARLVPEKSLLMVCIGGSIGKVAVCDREISFNQQINAIVCNEEWALPEYLFVIMRSPYFQDEVWRNATGTATPIINKSRWGKIWIPLPSTKEQVRIVAKVEDLMKQVDALSA